MYIYLSYLQENASRCQRSEHGSVSRCAFFCICTKFEHETNSIFLFYLFGSYSIVSVYIKVLACSLNSLTAWTSVIRIWKLENRSATQ